MLFSNHEDAPVIDAKRNYISGAAFRAQLLAGLDPKNLSPVGEPLPFYQSGFWRVEDLNIVVIPNVTPGEKVWVQVRVWETAEGEPEFAHAEEAERLVGDSNVFQVVTGGAGDPRTQPATLDELKTVVVRKPDEADSNEETTVKEGRRLTEAHQNGLKTALNGMTVPSI